LDKMYSNKTSMNIQKKRKEIKAKLKSRGKIFSGWTSLGHPQISEMIAMSGVDFVGIDIEHSTINQEQAQRIISVCHGQEVLCLPRVASHNAESIRRLLDSGADGIIVPTVETKEQVQDLVDYIKYPPIGKRGFGIARAQGYGHNFDDYISSWNENSSFIIQIESIKAVKNIDSILKADEIDGVMIGPYDISGSLGIPGQISHPDVVDACKIVIESCLKYNLSCGTQDINPTYKSITEQFKLGFTFIVLSSDIFLFKKWGEEIGRMIKKIDE
jgi:2-keto-3-deoxy-L-rhamnonate aldolase RhmA